MNEIKLFLNNGKIINIEMPTACKITVFYYDAEGSDVDDEGKKCHCQIWTKYPYEGYKQVKKIDKDVIIKIKNNKIIKATGTKGVVINVEETFTKKKGRD